MPRIWHWRDKSEKIRGLMFLRHTTFFYSTSFSILMEVVFFKMRYLSQGQLRCQGCSESEERRRSDQQTAHGEWCWHFQKQTAILPRCMISSLWLRIWIDWEFSPLPEIRTNHIQCDGPRQTSWKSEHIPNKASRYSDIDNLIELSEVYIEHQAASSPHFINSSVNRTCDLEIHFDYRRA